MWALFFLICQQRLVSDALDAHSKVMPRTQLFFNKSCMVSCVPRERARFAMTSSLLQKCLVVVTNDLLDQVNALFIHCHMCIQVYFTALCARCLSVEHRAPPLLCRWTWICPVGSSQSHGYQRLKLARSYKGGLIVDDKPKFLST